MTTNKDGLVYVITGNGKGKTTSALGMAVRSLAHGQSVIWISWYKTEKWPIGEIQLPAMLSPKYKSNIQMYWVGKGFFLSGAKNKKVGKAGIVYDFDTREGHKKAAESGLKLANAILSMEIPGWGKVTDLLILDEILITVEDELLNREDVIDLLDRRGRTKVVMTGRGKTDWLKDKVDLISEINKVKHPFDSGILAVAGLDY